MDGRPWQNPNPKSNSNPIRSRGLVPIHLSPSVSLSLFVSLSLSLSLSPSSSLPLSLPHPINHPYTSSQTLSCFLSPSSTPPFVVLIPPIQRTVQFRSLLCYISHLPSPLCPWFCRAVSPPCGRVGLARSITVPYRFITLPGEACQFQNITTAQFPLCLEGLDCSAQKGTLNLEEITENPSTKQPAADPSKTATTDLRNETVGSGLPDHQWRIPRFLLHSSKQCLSQLQLQLQLPFLLFHSPQLHIGIHLHTSALPAFPLI